MEMAHFSEIRMRVVAASLWVLLVLGADASFCSSDKVDELLKRLNKPPLKSIKSGDGDTIDCVHILQQPAFDHPSLKSHSIQMWPSYTPEELVIEKNVTIKQIWHLNGMCPEETIPIRRTKREDILRAMTVESFGKKQHKSISLNASLAEIITQHEYAVASVREDKYYGTKATIDLWAPKVQHGVNEFSLSQLWILGGDFNLDLNTIEVGWQVFPFKYKDQNPRLFIYWTSDNYEQTGCYNLECSGFIQTSNKIAIGGALSPVSHYKGAQQSITILVWKDKKQGNWWLRIGKDIIGYWPSKLFSHLDKNADLVEWGGEIVNSESSGRHTTTQMGSGHFPTEGYTKASYFSNIQIVDDTNTLKPARNLKTHAKPSGSCYDIKIGVVPIANWGSYFYYGGPGRNSACP